MAAAAVPGRELLIPIVLARIRALRKLADEAERGVAGARRGSVLEKTRVKDVVCVAALGRQVFDRESET